MKNEQTTVHQGLRHLREMGVEARLVGKPNSAIEISAAGQKHRFLLELKKSLRPADLGPILMISAALRDSVVVAPTISRTVGERLRNAEIHYFDACGNAYLTGPDLYILVEGRKSSGKGKAHPPPDRAFRPAGLKLIFALLSRPDLMEASYRDLARFAHISLGSVAEIIRSLEELDFISRVRGNVRLINRESLLDEWSRQYGRVMLERGILGRFWSPEGNWWRKATTKLDGALWGGEVAAAHLLGHLVPGEISLYCESVPRSLVQAFRLRKDESGPIIIRRKFWHFSHDLQQTNSVVPPPLIYAELLANGDARSIEAAKAIEEDYIRGSLRA